MPGRSACAEMEAKGKESAPAPWRVRNRAEKGGPGLPGGGAGSVAPLRDFWGGGVVGKALLRGG